MGGRGNRKRGREDNGEGKAREKGMAVTTTSSRQMKCKTTREKQNSY